MEHMPLTYPIFIMSYSLLQPFPNEESRLKNIVRPFTATVTRIKEIKTNKRLLNLKHYHIKIGLDFVSHFNHHLRHFYKLGRYFKDRSKQR